MNNEKKTIFYFSGTGGSLATAMRIAEELPEFSLQPIAAINGIYEVDSDTIGIVFPLYYAGLPRIVTRFIQNLKFKKTCYIFAIITCGFPWSGYAMHQLNRLLHHSKQKLTTGFYLKMVDNFLPHYDVPSSEQLEVIYKSCEEKMQTIISCLRARKSIIEADKAFFLYTMYPFFIRMLKRYDKYFSTDAHCNGCGLCSQVCPVDNIKLAESVPRWKHNCEFCLACISFCPNKAIQWKNVTQKKGRYHYKGITASQISNQKKNIKL